MSDSFWLYLSFFAQTPPRISGGWNLFLHSRNQKSGSCNIFSMHPRSEERQNPLWQYSREKLICPQRGMLDPPLISFHGKANCWMLVEAHLQNSVESASIARVTVCIRIDSENLFQKSKMIMFRHKWSVVSNTCFYVSVTQLLSKGEFCCCEWQYFTLKFQKFMAFKVFQVIGNRSGNFQ